MLWCHNKNPLSVKKEIAQKKVGFCKGRNNSDVGNLSGSDQKKKSNIEHISGSLKRKSISYNDFTTWLQLHSTY